MATRRSRAPAKDPYMDGSGGWPIPTFDHGMTFRDIGSTGLRQYSGYVREEFSPALMGREAVRVYREMRDNSPTVGAIMFAILGVMRKVEWRTEPANDSAEAAKLAEFADSLRLDMSHSWEDFIVEALSMLTYGFAPHEIIYKRRMGQKRPSSPFPSSKFNDGLVGIRRLPIRGQDTVVKWFFGVNGEILGLTQQPYTGPLIDLPIEKLLLFRPTQHKGNPEGYSVLRTAYRSYYFIKRLEEQEAILFERMSGLPTLKLPNQLLEAANAGDPGAVATLAAYKKIVTNVRIDEQMGLLLPSDMWPGTTGGASTAPMFEFKFEVPQGGTKSGVDADKTIARHKLDIMTSVLADFIQLGHEERGTQSLAVTKVDLFMQAVEGWMNAIAAVLNRHLLPRVWALNGLNIDLMPQYAPDMVQRIDLDVLSNFILRLSQAGMPLFPDEPLEEALRDGAGLPEIDPGERAKVLAAQKEAADAANGKNDKPKDKPLKKAIRDALKRQGSLL
jgi:hypothetical protein